MVQRRVGRRLDGTVFDPVDINTDSEHKKTHKADFQSTDDHRQGNQFKRRKHLHGFIGKGKQKPVFFRAARQCQRMVPRTYVVAVLQGVMLHLYTRPVAAFSKDMGYAAAPWPNSINIW